MPIAIDLTDREVAVLIWAILFGIFAVVTTGWRKALELVGGLRPFFLSLLSYAAWYGLAVGAASALGLWDASLLKDALVWFSAPGMLLFFRFPRTYEGGTFLRGTLLKLLGLTAVVEVFLNLVSFPLVVELLLIPLFALTTLLTIVAGQRTETKRLQGPLNAIQVALSVAWLVATAVVFAARADGPDAAGLARAFALPIWSTAACLVFVQVFGLIANYQSHFVRLDHIGRDDKEARRRAKAALVLWFGPRSRALHSFRGVAIQDLAAAPTYAVARAVIRLQQAEVKAEVAQKALTAARLARYAGDEGTDWEGRPLDQREFKETRDALRELHLYHRAQYEQRGRYRDDLMQVVGDLLARTFGGDPGITMKVGKNGRNWFAWRRTVGGWVLGIGALGRPPSLWTYESREAPARGPGRGAANWQRESEDS